MEPEAAVATEPAYWLTLHNCMFSKQQLTDMRDHEKQKRMVRMAAVRRMAGTGPSEGQSTPSSQQPSSKQRITDHPAEHYTGGG